MNKNIPRLILIALNAVSFLTLQAIFLVELPNQNLELVILLGAISVCIFTGIPLFRKHWNKAHLQRTGNHWTNYSALSFTLFIMLFGSLILVKLNIISANFDLLEWIIWCSLYFMLTIPVFTYNLRIEKENI